MRFLKFFVLFAVVMLTFLTSIVHPQREGCGFAEDDLPDCDGGRKLTKECCDELKQHLNCYCSYERFSPWVSKTLDECCVSFWDNCPNIPCPSLSK